MALFTKPTDVNKVWSSGGDIIAPGDAKIASGWGIEIPPRQYFNYIDNKQDAFIAHVNQMGIPVWDSVTEYQADKSYVQGSTGAVYRCVQTHTNQNPETDVTDTYWALAFANPTEFYTKVEADGLYLAKAQNLSDLPNTATARTNLSVYAKSETYTKGEVDLKTTVSSTAQSQAWTSNTTLITPLRLAEAFGGFNQSLTPSGYQKLPGGLIIQWGQTAASAAGDNTTTVPIAFPNQFLEVYLTQDYTVGTGSIGYAGAIPTSLTQFTWAASVTGNAFSFFAIGR